MNNHKDMIRTVIFVEKKFQDEMLHERKLQTKHNIFFWFQVGYIKVYFQTYFTKS